MALITNPVPPVLSVVAHLGRHRSLPRMIGLVTCMTTADRRTDLWDRYRQGCEPRRAVPPP